MEWSTVERFQSFGQSCAWHFSKSIVYKFAYINESKFWKSWGAYIYKFRVFYGASEFVNNIILKFMYGSCKLAPKSALILGQDVSGKVLKKK